MPFKASTLYPSAHDQISQRRNNHHSHPYLYQICHLSALFLCLLFRPQIHQSFLQLFLLSCFDLPKNEFVMNYMNRILKGHCRGADWINKTIKKKRIRQGSVISLYSEIHKDDNDLIPFILEKKYYPRA